MKTEQIPEFISDDLTESNDFNVIVNPCIFGYFYMFRTVWRFRTQNGLWWEVALFIILQLLCTLPALFSDIIMTIIYYFVKLLYFGLKRFFKIFFLVIGAALGLFLIYFFIATGLWRNLFNFLLNLL